MRRSLLLWALGVAGFVVVVFLLVAMPGVTVLDENGVPPDTATEKFRVQLGAVSFWVAQQDQSAPDELNALLLAMLAGMALLTGLFFRGFMPVRLPRLQPFFGAVAVGAALLALDEAFELMQTLAHNIPIVASTEAIRARDVEGLAWLLPVGAFLWYFRDVLRSSRLVTAFWGIGGALFLGGVVLDFGFPARLEDTLEIGATCAFLAGFTALAFDRMVDELVRDYLEPARESSVSAPVGREARALEEQALLR